MSATGQTARKTPPYDLGIAGLVSETIGDCEFVHA
jgi:hypothetical protein